MGQLISWALSLLGGTTLKKISTVIIIALVAGAYFYVKNDAYNNGVAVTTLKYEKAQQEAVDEAVKQVKAKNEANKSIAQAYWENKLAKKPKIKTIEKRIIEYVEVQSANDSPECLLDDGELFILQDLVSIANSTTKDTHRYGTDAIVRQDPSTK